MPSMLEGVRTAAELERLRFPNTELVEGGVLHTRSRLMLAGDAGIGKSYMALQLGWEAAMGEPWLGVWPMVKPLRTLIIQVEVSEALFQRRYLRLKSKLPNPDMLYAKTDEEFVLVENSESLRATIDTLEIELVILDPLYLMHTGDENAIHTIRPTQRIIDQLRREYGTTFVIVHHVNKAAADMRPSMNMLRGSSGWAGWVDTILLATRGADDINVHMLKARNRQEGLPKTAYKMDWNSEAGKFFRFVGGGEDALSLIVQAVDEVGDEGAANMGDVVTWLKDTHGWSKSSTYRRLAELTTRGFIQKIGRKLYLKENAE